MADCVEMPEVASLAALAREENDCRRCPLYRDATQAVPGEGPRRAALMLVGEQPGDREDVEGRPFVGPAGKLLDRALETAGLDRGSLFVTNAVKHFKHEQRGKRRLHKTPNASEIDHCRWWLGQEIALVRPRVILAMGGSAVRGVFGRPRTIRSLRGRAHALDGGIRALATVHPSALLRMRGEESRDRAFKDLVDDLRLCREALKDGLTTR